MRMSKTITLSFLGLGTIGLAAGCGGQPEPTTPSPAPPMPDVTPPADPEPPVPSEISVVPDETWYDADGKKIEEEWAQDTTTGRRVPVTHPHDQFGRKWVYDSEGNLVPPPPTTVRPTPLFGGFIFIPAIPGGRPGGSVVTRPNVPRATGFGATGARVGGSTT